MNAILIAQVVVSVLLVFCVLLQRGQAGLGTVFGGSVTEAFRTKRGFEAFLHNFTIFLSVIFVALALTNVILSR